jgi:glutathione S-transferase
MIALWQTEWCPASRRIRQRLTELDVTYLVHQVPVDRTERGALVAATGSDTIPALEPGDGSPALVGEDAIRAFLDERFAEPAGAHAHHAKAEKARRREVQAAAEELVRSLSDSRTPQEVLR